MSITLPVPLWLTDVWPNSLTDNWLDSNTIDRNKNLPCFFCIIFVANLFILKLQSLVWWSATKNLLTILWLLSVRNFFFNLRGILFRDLYDSMFAIVSRLLLFFYNQFLRMRKREPIFRQRRRKRNGPVVSLFVWLYTPLSYWDYTNRTLSPSRAGKEKDSGT